MQPDFGYTLPMVTLTEHISRTLEVKQSKFIAHIMPYSLFETVLAELKSEHPKARHFVTAFRYLNTYDQIVEGSSDDGEPKGTSGKPTLAVLQGHEMINAAVITVRYFGGTKLGTGGLVRAYSDALNQVLNEAQSVVYVKLESLHFHVKYAYLSQVQYALEQSGISEITKQFEAEYVMITAKASAKALASFQLDVKRLIRIF